MTYGQMPTREEFDAAFEEICPDGYFKFGNDPIYGDSWVTASDLWAKMNSIMESAIAPDEDAEQVDWVGDVLNVLGFEWV